MAELNLYIMPDVLNWKKEDGDCSECVTCGDEIFGNKYSVRIVVENSGEEICRLSLCESCKELWDEQSKDTIGFWIGD